MKLLIKFCRLLEMHFESKLMLYNKLYCIIFYQSRKPQCYCVILNHNNSKLTLFIYHISVQIYDYKNTTHTLTAIPRNMKRWSIFRCTKVWFNQTLNLKGFLVEVKKSPSVLQSFYIAAMFQLVFITIFSLPQLLSIIRGYPSTLRKPTVSLACFVGPLLYFYRIKQWG